MTLKILYGDVRFVLDILLALLFEILDFSIQHHIGVFKNRILRELYPSVVRRKVKIPLNTASQTQ